MSFCVHITGASGAGTSTLGRALATRLGIPQIESDDIIWEPTDPPFQTLRDRAARQPLLIAATSGAAWVLSGSINRNIRSRALHEAWIATLPCPLLRLDGLTPTENQVERVLEALNER